MLGQVKICSSQIRSETASAHRFFDRAKTEDDDDDAGPWMWLWMPQPGAVRQIRAHASSSSSSSSRSRSKHISPVERASDSHPPRQMTDVVRPPVIIFQLRSHSEFRLLTLTLFRFRFAPFFSFYINDHWTVYVFELFQGLQSAIVFGSSRSLGIRICIYIYLVCSFWSERIGSRVQFRSAAVTCNDYPRRWAAYRNKTKKNL